jgi:hypothetical protein
LLALALLGSRLCVFNVLGRTAADRDRTQAMAMAQNRVLADRGAELDRARAEMTRECRQRAQRCREWEARVDALQRETAPMLAIAIDPRADAIGRLAVLVGLDGEQAKQIVRAIEPAMLPAFLEIGAIVLLGIAFPVRKAAMVTGAETIADPEPAIAPQPFTREQALRDLLAMREAGSGRVLAQRWQVDPATVSRWLQSFELAGHIKRERAGQSKAVAMIAHKPRRQLPAT